MVKVKRRKQLYYNEYSDQLAGVLVSLVNLIESGTVSPDVRTMFQDLANINKRTMSDIEIMGALRADSHVIAQTIYWLHKAKVIAIRNAEDESTTPLPNALPTYVEPFESTFLEFGGERNAYPILYSEVSGKVLQIRAVLLYAVEQPDKKVEHTAVASCTEFNVAEGSNFYESTPGDFVFKWYASQGGERLEGDKYHSRSGGWIDAIGGHMDHTWRGIGGTIERVISYINSDPVHLQERHFQMAANAKRTGKSGGTEKQPYYVCQIRKQVAESPVATGEGAAHSFRYDVRGHWRHYKDGRTVWVKAHQRGPDDASYIPKLYNVDLQT